MTTEMKDNLKEMETKIDTVASRMDIFEETLDKVDTAVNASQEKTEARIETG
jgi:chaperonin cofactor prefoldin